jgi:hypothetical protein
MNRQRLYLAAMSTCCCIPQQSPPLERVFVAVVPVPPIVLAAAHDEVRAPSPA